MNHTPKILTIAFVIGIGISPAAAWAEDLKDPYADFESAFSESLPPEKPAKQEPEKETTTEKETEISETVATQSTEEVIPEIQVSQPSPALTSPSGILDRLRLEGSFRNETAYRTYSPEQLSKVRNQAIFVQSLNISDDLSIKVTERGYYDSVFDFTDNYPKNVRQNMDHELEFRDTYIDYSSGDFDVRIGKQQIVWGESVGLFFADIVNAKDLREFVLPDFDLIRIPEWALNVEYSKNDFHLEALYIPLPEFNKIGVENSEYEFQLPVPENVPYQLLGAEKPANTLDNSQYGTRMTYLTDGWDLGVFYLYTWDKSPVYYRSFNPTTSELLFSPGYRRQHITGVTFSKEISKVILKGEVVVNPEATFSTADEHAVDGLEKKTFIDYVLGADIELFDSIQTNYQFIQRVIFNHDDNLINNEDAVSNYASFWAKKAFLNESLEPEFLIISSLMKVDLLIRPSIRYKFAGNWDWKGGLDYFTGERTELLGQFETGSRVYSELTYRF